MYVLGVSCYYHDSSATLLKNGKIVAAAEEERFTRKKHDEGFPINAIKYCLKSQNITIKEVDYVGFYEKPLLKFERLLYQHLQSFPKSYKAFLSSTPSWINEKLRIIKTIIKKLKYNGDVLFIPHHMAHAASSFLVSPFRESAIVTVDGVGEWTTTTVGYGKNNKIELINEIRFPHSLGLLYSTLTAYLGFKVNNSEFKVMGLASYGLKDKNKNPYYKKLKKAIDVKEDGSFRLDMTYFKYHYADRMPSEKLCKLLGGPIRKPESKLTQKHKNIAAALQMITEETLFKILKYVHKKTKGDNLVLSGGVALNSVFNGKVLKNSPFKKVWIQPAAGDGGTSLGVAQHIYNVVLGKKRDYVMDSASFGPGFSTREINQFLDENEINYSVFKNKKELVKKTAGLIYEDNVVGWFQGRMEFGPRALGNRSILANPLNPKMKKILNKKVKHRESFRPFAPVVCREDTKKFFECDSPLPQPTDFMLMVYPIKKKWHKKLPSVTHVDGSGRLQTIRKKQNRLYYDLIKEFGKISGVPMLINTSFNIRGEPIVCTPYDAYTCMMGTGIDYMILDKFLIKRKDNSKDTWNSQKNAKN